MNTFYLELIFLPFMGFLMGILSLLYGMGGGIILIPVIYFFLRNLGFSEDLAMEFALGTSLLTIFAGTLTAAYHHYKDKHLLWPVVYLLLSPLIIGALLGIGLSHFFDGAILRRVFIVFLVFVLFHSLFSRNFKRSWTVADYERPSTISASVTGIMIGIISVLVGMGGGILLIPYLRQHRLPMLQTTAITTALSPVLTLIGSVGYFWMHVDAAPPYSIGAINFPIFVCLFIGSWFGILFGEKLNTQFSESLRAKTFPVLIAIILILMLI